MAQLVPVVRPWRDREEFLEVYNLLFSGPISTSIHLTEDVEDIKYAIEIIQIWRKRGNTPHFVISTARLIEALLHHSEVTNGQLALHHSALSGIFESGIARFVTGFCDTAQTGSVKRSMYEVALDLHMPETWVEMRHEITHGEVPNLQDMVRVAREAVEWLRERYWKSMIEAPKAVRMESIGKEQMKEILKGVLKERKDELRSGTMGKSEELIRQISSDLSTRTDRDLLVKVLLECKLLLPRSKAQDLNMKVAYAIWDPPLQTLKQAHPSVYSTLVTQLQKMLVTRSHSKPGLNSEKDAVIEWITHLLFHPQFRPADTALLEDTLEFCLLNPSEWTILLGTKLLEKCSAAFRKDWAHYFQGSHGTEDADDPTTEDVEIGDVSPGESDTTQRKQSVYRQVWTARPIGIL